MQKTEKELPVTVMGCAHKTRVAYFLYLFDDRTKLFRVVVRSHDADPDNLREFFRTATIEKCHELLMSLRKYYLLSM